MTTAPASASETRPPRRRGWGQFSLVSLLLLAVIGCLVGAYIAEMRRRQAAEEVLRQKDAEIRQNRIDLGLLDDQPNVLTITDPSKVHIRQLPSGEPRTNWRWRIYLPPGTRWQQRIDQGEKWDEERQSFNGSGSGTDVGRTGEFTLEGWLERGIDGRAMLRFRRGTGESGTWVPDAGLTILQADGKRTFVVAGQQAQESFDARGRIELFRHHVHIADGQPLPEGTTLPGRLEPSREYGFSISLQEGSLHDEIKKHQSTSKRDVPSNSTANAGD